MVVVRNLETEVGESVLENENEMDLWKKEREKWFGKRSGRHVVVLSKRKLSRRYNVMCSDLASWIPRNAYPSFIHRCNLG
ncbi:hypothetical protein Tco_0327587 [Tanacetum coccineum]